MTETANQIHGRMMDNVNEVYDRTEGSFIWDATKAGALEFEEQQRRTEEIRQKFDIENLVGEELARFVYQRTGIVRKPATKATTTLVVSGTAGAEIRVGDLFSSDTANFVATATRTIGANGMVEVPVESVEFGSIGNVPAGSIDHIPTSIQGVVDAYNPEPATNGYDAESDEELRERYYNKLQRPGKAGNVYHYQEWAEEVTGVGGVRVEPRWNGPLTVRVIIIDANGQPASTELVDAVTEHIDQERPFGADVTVESAVPVPINLTVTLTLADNYVETDVIDGIKVNIAEYLQSIAFKSDYVSYAKIGSVIIGTEGVLDYQDLTVNGGTSNVPVSINEVAVMGGVNE